MTSANKNVVITTYTLAYTSASATKRSTATTIYTMASKIMILVAMALCPAAAAGRAQ